MKVHSPALAALLAAAILAPAAASAQEPLTSFDQLNTRLEPGNTVWVIATQGREITGKIRELGPSSLTLDSGGPQIMQAAAIERVERRSTRTRHAMYGMLAGAIAGVVAGYVSYHQSSEGAPTDPLVLAGMFGGIGAAIGAIFPGRTTVVYRAPGAASAAQPRLSIAPVITPRTRGVAVSFAF
jgi:hypothetical protein